MAIFWILLNILDTFIQIGCIRINSERIKKKEKNFLFFGEFNCGEK